MGKSWSFCSRAASSARLPRPPPQSATLSLPAMLYPSPHGHRTHLCLSPLRHHSAALRTESVHCRVHCCSSHACLQPDLREACSQLGGHDGCSLPWSPCFLTELRPTSPGMAPPTTGCALPHQTLFKKIPYMLSCSQILGVFSLLRFPPLHSLCQADLN